MYRHDFDLCIVAEYGGLKRKVRPLPDATRRGISIAANMFNQGLVEHVAWGNSERPGPGATILHTEKMEIFSRFGIGPESVTAVTSNNTIQEVSKIVEAVREKDVRNVIVICDWFHAPRYKLIAKYFFGPNVSITIRTFRAEWNEDHPSPWQKSRFRWFLCNFIYYHIMWWYRSFGRTDAFMKRFQNVTHVD